MKKRPKLRLVGKDDGDGKGAGDGVGVGDDGAASVFDDLDGLRAAMASAGAPPYDAPRGSQPLRRARATETFARMPHKRALELFRRHRLGGSAWAVLVELDRMVLAQRGKNPVLFWSPNLKKIGVSRSVRMRALRRLEAAGMVEVTQRGKGLAPWVAHLWYPRQK